MKQNPRIQIKLTDRSGIGSKMISADTSKNDISNIGGGKSGLDLNKSLETSKYDVYEEEFINLSKIRKQQQRERTEAE